MTRSRPAGKGLTILVNAVALMIGFPIALYGWFLIGLDAVVIGVALGGALGLAGYHLRVWPALTIIAFVVMGLAVLGGPGDCATDPSCDGSAGDAWPNHPLAFLVFVGSMLAGSVAGLVHDFKGRAGPPSDEAEPL